MSSPASLQGNSVSAKLKPLLEPLAAAKHICLFALPALVCGSVFLIFSNQGVQAALPILTTTSSIDGAMTPALGVTLLAASVTAVHFTYMVYNSVVPLMLLVAASPVVYRSWGASAGTLVLGVSAWAAIVLVLRLWWDSRQTTPLK